MNRRELLSSMATAVTAAGVTTASVKAMDSTEPPALLVIESDALMGAQGRDNLQTAMVEGLKGTPFEGVKVLVLDCGLKLRALDKSGAYIEPKVAEEQSA